MKKALSILFVTAMVLSFAGCARNLPTTLSPTYEEELAQMEVLSEWPQNQFTAEIPAFEVQPGSVLSQTKTETTAASGEYSIHISNVTESQYRAYVDALRAAGYRFDSRCHIDGSYDNPYEAKSIGYYTVNNILVTKIEYITVPTSILGKGTTTVSVSYNEENDYVASGLSITVSHDVSDMYLLDLSDRDSWQDCEAADRLPAPDFAAELPLRAGSGTLGAADVYCVKITGVSSEQYDQYTKQLEEFGFVSDSLKNLDGTPISDGTILVLEDGSMIRYSTFQLPCTEKTWHGTMETAAGTVECRVFFGPRKFFGADTNKFDATPFLYINILSPAE